jgi:glycosyltransferase 2 family protein
MERFRRLWPTIRIVASIAMLGYLAVRLATSGTEDLLPDWNASTLGWLSAAVGVTVLGIVLSAVRWQRVLAAIGLPARIGTLVWTYLASLFVGNFLISTIGGDVLRVTRLSKDNGSSPGTFASVVLERLTGWVVLPLITIAALLINPHLWTVDKATRVALLIAMITLVLLVVVLFLAAHPKVGGRMASNEGWRRFTGAIHLGLERFRHHPMAAAEVLVAGFVYQLAVVVAAFLAVRALGIHIGFTAVLAFMPVVAIVQVLPITIGGLGVREGAFALFLHDLGVGSDKAIALGLLLYGINLAASLLGAPAFAVGGRTRTEPQVTA